MSNNNPKVPKSSVVKKESDSPNPYKPNIWGMIRDIFIHGMNKGQLLVAGCLLLLIIIFVRIPENKLDSLVRDILTKLSNWHNIGWILFVIMTVIFYSVTKYLRINHTKEIKRMSKEKSRMQRDAATEDLPSSDNQL